MHHCVHRVLQEMHVNAHDASVGSFERLFGELVDAKCVVQQEIVKAEQQPISSAKHVLGSKHRKVCAFRFFCVCITTCFFVFLFFFQALTTSFAQRSALEREEEDEENSDDTDVQPPRKRARRETGDSSVVARNDDGDDAEAKEVSEMHSLFTRCVVDF